ncbi:Uncharacterised protein [Chlamydia trachomatis]|nr:Uncharacterised protein [Chlamydia trachomatis]
MQKFFFYEYEKKFLLILEIFFAFVTRTPDNTVNTSALVPWKDLLPRCFPLLILQQFDVYDHNATENRLSKKKIHIIFRLQRNKKGEKPLTRKREPQSLLAR